MLAQQLTTECNLKTDDLARKIVSMGEAIAGRTLYRYQLELAIAIVRACLIKDIPEESEITALYPRQCGKSEALAVVSIGCATTLPWLAKMFPDDDRLSSYIDGFMVGCYAPKQDKAQIIYDRVRKYAEGTGDSKHKAKIEKIYSELGIVLIKSRGDSLAWNNGSVIKAISASEKVDNEGDTNSMVIIDEAQKISGFKINKELRPTLASTNGPMVLIGTATSHKGYYYSKIRDNEDYQKKSKRRVHFQYDYKDVLEQRRAAYNRELKLFDKYTAADDEGKIELLKQFPTAKNKPRKYHLQYAAHIERQLITIRHNIEEESFKMNYRLLWQDNRNIAIPKPLILSMRLPSIELNECIVMNPIGAGLDIAKGSSEDADKTVLTMMALDISNPMPDKLHRGKPSEYLIHYMKIVIGIQTCQGSFEDEQYKRIIETISRYPTCSILYVDATGMGDPVAERLAKLLHWIPVIPYSYNVATKSRMFKKYVPEFKSGRIRWAAGPRTQETIFYDEFLLQHEGLQRYYVGNHESYSAEDGEHDDYPNSAALANLACEHMLEDKSIIKKFLTRDEQVIRDTSFNFLGAKKNYRESRNLGGLR